MQGARRLSIAAIVTKAPATVEWQMFRYACRTPIDSFYVQIQAPRGWLPGGAGPPGPSSKRLSGTSRRQQLAGTDILLRPCEPGGRKMNQDSLFTFAGVQLARGQMHE
jgi:hypothetical protein